MHDVIVIGDSCQDIFLILEEAQASVACDVNREDCRISFHYADKIPISKKYDAVGGNAANAAVSMARLGLQTAIYTHLGADRNGKLIQDEFAEQGIQLDYIVADNGKETNYNTVLSYLGERTIFSYHQDRDYRLPKLEPTKWMYLTSMKSGFEQMIPTLCAYLDQYNVKLVYQPGSYQLKLGSSVSTEILKRTEVLYLNKEEAMAYLGYTEHMPFSELLAGLHALGPKQVVITDGSNGTVGSNGKEAWFLDILKDIPRIETTGAGDGFASACTTALISGKWLGEGLRWGQMQAAGVIQKIGAEAGLLTQNELQEMLSKYPDAQAVPLDPAR